MPSDTLDLLDEIVKGAQAASGKAAGQPLRATEWNTLADAIARLARLAAAREKNEAETLAKSYARVDHEHLGQVGLTWFDPPTRALVEGRGGAADVVARLNDLARETKAVRTELTALTGQMDRMRDALRDATDGQRVRDRATETLGNRLDGVIDIDRRVTAVDDRLGRIGDQVQAALDFRNTLVDAAGAPLDLRGMAGRVGNLETSQERLRLADGEVVRIRDFESRIATLEERTVDDRILDTRIGQRLTEIVADPENPLVTRAGAAAVAALNPRIAILEAGAESTRNDIGGLREQRGADQVQLVGLGARADQQASQTDALTASVTGLGALPGRVVTLETGITDAITRITGLDALRGNMAAVQTQLVGLSGVAGDTATLRRDFDAQAARLDGVERNAAGIGALDTRLSTVELAAGGIGGIGTRLTAAETSLGALDGRVTVADSRLGALSSAASRISVLERSSADVAAWRNGVDERLIRLPDRTALTDLTTRLSTVEASTAAQQTRISAISSAFSSRTVFTPVVRPTR